jgi:hypothetical protein
MDINCYRFLIFNFDLEYLIRVQSSEPLHAKMNLNSCLFGSPFALLKSRSFPPNRAPKMREKHQLFFGLRRVSKEFQHLAIQTKIEQHFGGFCYQIIVRQPIGRQDSMQTVIRTMDSFLHEAAQNCGTDERVMENTDPTMKDSTKVLPSFPCPDTPHTPYDTI